DTTEAQRIESQIHSASPRLRGPYAAALLAALRLVLFLEALDVGLERGPADRFRAERPQEGRRFGAFVVAAAVEGAFHDSERRLARDRHEARSFLLGAALGDRV